MPTYPEAGDTGFAEALRTAWIASNSTLGPDAPTSENAYVSGGGAGKAALRPTTTPPHA